MSDTQSEYDIGAMAALDAMETIAAKVSSGSPVASLMGLITTSLKACYEMSPNEFAADHLIETCMKFAKEDSNENNERENGQ